MWENFLNWLVETGTGLGLRLVAAIVVLIVGSIIIKTIVKRFNNSKKGQALDPTVRSFIHSFISIGLWLILVVAIVSLVGVPMASIIAVIASAGLALGLALQGALSNMAGGIMILIFRPFNVGDYILANGLEGNVIEVGIFYTVIRTLDNKQITIPNGTMMNSAVTNFSKEPQRRVDIDFAIHYSNDADKACAAAICAAVQNELILSDPEPFAKVTALADSSVTLTVRAWCDNANYWDARFSLIRDVRNAFEREGIKFAYPQMDVHIDNK